MRCPPDDRHADILGFVDHRRPLGACAADPVALAGEGLAGRWADVGREPVTAGARR